MNTYLNVPYAQKDAAKSHGARWDAQRKQWYYPGYTMPDGLKQFTAAPSSGNSGRRFYRCPRCGTTGYSGAYPFSTCPPTCDDCN